MNRDLTNLSELKAILARAGIRPTTSAGQHFLICAEVIEATMAALPPRVTAITELGAGCGVLTLALLAVGRRVRAFERDAALAEVLAGVVPTSRRAELDLQVQDLREGVWEWDEPYALVGNIPYNLSGLIGRRLVQLDPAPERAVLLVQHEVADRLVGADGRLTLLGLAVQLWGEAHRLLNVPATCFWPAPKVASGLVVLVPDARRRSVGQREQVLQVARHFFQQKRKQIGGVFRRTFAVSDAQMAAVLDEAQLAPTRRPESIGAIQWIRLTEVMARHGLTSMTE